MLPLQSTAAEGAETLVKDAAFPLHGPGSVGGTKWHSLTTCLFPIGKSRCAKSNQVQSKRCLGTNQLTLASAGASAAEENPSPG